MKQAQYKTVTTKSKMQSAEYNKTMLKIVNVSTEIIYHWSHHIMHIVHQMRHIKLGSGVAIQVA